MRISAHRQEIGKCEKKQLMIIKKKKLSIGRLRGVHVSSNVNETIRAILNLFIYLFIFTGRFHTHKKRKTHTSEQSKKDSISMRIKTSKRKKIACLTFCAFCSFYAFYAFYAHKKRLTGGKSLVSVLCLLRFLCFLCFL